jgi:hypothetical protein
MARCNSLTVLRQSRSTLLTLFVLSCTFLASCNSMARASYTLHVLELRTIADRHPVDEGFTKGAARHNFRRILHH